MENRISVSILTYNGGINLEKTLRSIIKQKGIKFEILIVDNHSEDKKTQEIINNYIKRYDQIRVIKNKSNYGYNKGKNIAVNNSRYNFVYLLDDDIELRDKETLIKLLEFYQSKKDMGFCSVPLKDKNKRLVSHTGCFYSVYGQKINRSTSLPNLMKKKMYLTGAPIGGNIFFNKKVWNKLGGYEEIQPFNFDDYYLGALSYILNFKNYIYSEVYAVHNGTNRRSSNESFYNKFKFFLSGNLLTINIIYNNKNRFFISQICFIFILLKALKNAIFRLDLKPIRAFLESLIFFIEHYKYMRYKRTIVQSKRVVKEDIFLKIKPPKFD